MRKPMRKRKDKPEAMSRKDATKMRSMDKLNKDPYFSKINTKSGKPATNKDVDSLKHDALYKGVGKLNQEKNARAIMKKNKLSSGYKSGGAKSSKVPKWAGGK